MRVQLRQISMIADHAIVLANIRQNTMSRRFLPLLALLPVLISAYAIQETWFGLLALLGYLVGCGRALGPRLAPSSPRPLQLGLGAMATVASLSILGSIVYYSALVTTESLVAVLAVVAAVACTVYRPNPAIAAPSTLNRIDLSLGVTAVIALIGWWIALLTTHITEPTRSLWLELDPFTVTSLGLACAMITAILLRNRSPYLALGLLACLLFSAMSAAAIVYDIGYGFDPFLHRATVSHIAEHGTITPKPLYYIGEYALELIGIKIFQIPLFTLNTLLAPLLASFGIVVALANRQAITRAPGLALASLFFLPLAAFVQTTPQALAFIFTAWTLFVHARPRITPAIFAFAAVLTHPLAGIGAVIYVVLLAFDDIPDIYRPWRIAGITLATIAAALSIPIAFTIQAELAQLEIRFSFANIFKVWQLPIDTFFTTQYNAWGDIAYSFIGNAFLIVLVLAVVGVALTPKTTYGWYVPGLVALATFVNFMIISLGFDFTYLIAYERLDFALRLLTLTTLFLLPYVAVLLVVAWQKLRLSPVGLRLGAVILFAIFFTANIYGAYPRHDNYARSAGFNVGPTDFDAVTAIEKMAGSEDYLVLSDQALAAAAVQELGFKQYYSNDIFFYPIPTGGPLYQLYLDMVEDRPSRETMESAMDLTDVNLAFFAIHDYWWQAPQIIENAKAVADDWLAVGDGDVTIFIFRR